MKPITIGVALPAAALASMLLSDRSARASSPDAWAALDAQIKKAEAACRRGAAKEAGLNHLGPAQDAHFTATAIIVPLEGSISASATDKAPPKTVFCLVSRKTGKAEYAGTMP